MNMRRWGAHCERWSGAAGFVNFLADMGPRPSDRHQLLRLDVSKQYAPDNCIWTDSRRNVPSKGRSRYRHGMHGTPTWNSWQRMLNRCYNEKNNRFYAYGARGISVCARWRESFENFLSDMGERPDDFSLDRVDPNGNYEPSNCRWASRFEQARNKQSTKLEEHEPAQIRWLLSEGYTQVEIARFFGISQSLVSLIKLDKSWMEESR